MGKTVICKAFSRLTPAECENIIERMAIEAHNAATMPTILGVAHSTRIPVREASPPRWYYKSVMGYCIQMGLWPSDPPLVRLVDSLKYSGLAQEVVDALEALPKPEHLSRPGYPPHQIQLLPEDSQWGLRPYLGGDDTRQAIEDFFDQFEDDNVDALRVLLLMDRPNQEEPGSKVLEYLKYRQMFQPWSVYPIYIRFDSSQAFYSRRMLLEEILKQILPDFSAPLPADDLQEWHRQALRLLVRTIYDARERTDRNSPSQYIQSSAALWLLVLDNFDDLNVPEETLRFIEELLVFLTARPDVRRTFGSDAAKDVPLRLIISGYSHQRCEILERLDIEDARFNYRRLRTIPLPAWHLSHVESFLVDFFEFMLRDSPGMTNPFGPEKTRELAKDIWNTYQEYRHISPQAASGQGLKMDDFVLMGAFDAWETHTAQNRGGHPSPTSNPTSGTEGG